MQFDEFFDVYQTDDIRLKGTRVGIETILLAYLHEKLSAEEIAKQYDTVTLAQIHGTILYYLMRREEAEAYLENYLAGSRKRQAEFDKNPPPVVVRLRALQEAQRQNANTV